jgi:F0F1-type ATP synthase assembly protein I
MASDLSTTQRDVTRSLHRSHGSFELAFAPLIMALLGLWLDRTIDTVPVFTLVLAAVGIAGSAAKVYYSYRHEMAALELDAPWQDRSGATTAEADR